MPRKVPEWIGKRDDTMPPPRVRLRIFDRENGVCHWCKLPIKFPAETWEADHKIALVNGGENRETNLAPIHSHCHLEKTCLDLVTKKKVAKVRQRHIGIKRPAGKLRSAGFPKSEKPARVSRSLPPRAMFVSEDQP